MAAFDVTTKPTSLPLKPGVTGSIMVVVSNKTGKPVMGLIEGTLTPATAAKWLLPLPASEAQRRYEADPSATVNFEFKVAVPADAVAQDVQFRATVRDVLAPDDTKVEGQTVAIKVTPDVIIKKENGGGIPWWVWLVAAVVIIGAGVGIWRIVGKKGVPNVVRMSPESASSKLKKAGFDSVAIVDTLADPGADTNLVIRQVPEAKGKIPGDSLKVATIVVNRPAVVVPQVANQPVAVAIERLKQAGLVLGNNSGVYTPNVGQNQTISGTSPPEGTKLRAGAKVDLIIYAYSPTKPCAGPKCTMILDPALVRKIDVWKATH